MKKLIFLYIALIANALHSQPLLMTVNQDSIYTSEFERKQIESLKLLGVEQTINNFINFTLLKQYAVNRGVKDSEGFYREFTTESQKIKDSLYYPPQRLDSVLRDYYNKINIEKKIQLLFFKNEVLPQDKKERDNFIKAIIREIGNNPENFEKMVEKYSSTQEFKKPVYFDIFLFDQYSLNEIYKAPLNKVVEFKQNDQIPGLLLVSDERKYLGEVALDEILIKDTSEAGRKKIWNIYERLKKGESFIELKEKYSENRKIKEEEDLYTIIQNDTLYNYVLNRERTTLIPPLKTAEGYKIFIYLYGESYDNYSLAYSRLYERLKKSPIKNEMDKELINELKKYSFYRINIDEINNFINLLPETYAEFESLELNSNTTLITLEDGYGLTAQELLSQLKNISENEYPYIKNLAQYLISSWLDKSLLEYYEIHFYQLDRFKEPLKDLENKILIKAAISIISEEAIKDVEGQKRFLDEKSNTFTWKERIQGTFYSCLNSTVEKEVLKMLKQGKSKNYIKDYYKGKKDANNNELLAVDQGKFSREFLNLPREGELNEKLYIVDYKNRRMIVVIEDIIADDKMSLEELQTTYIGEYIDYKIGEVMKELRKNATVEINKSQEEILVKKYDLLVKKL